MKRSDTKRSLWSSLTGSSNSKPNSNQPPVLTTKSTSASSSYSQNSPLSPTYSSESTFKSFSKSFSKHSKLNNLASNDKLCDGAFLESREQLNSRNSSKMSLLNKRKSMIGIPNPQENKMSVVYSSKRAPSEEPSIDDYEDDTTANNSYEDLADLTIDSTNVLDFNLDFDDGLNQNQDNSHLLDSAFNDYELALKAFSLDDYNTNSPIDKPVIHDDNEEIRQRQSVMGNTLHRLKKSQGDHQLPTINKDDVSEHELYNLHINTLAPPSTLSLISQVHSRTNGRNLSISDVEVVEGSGFILVGTCLPQENDFFQEDRGVPDLSIANGFHSEVNNTSMLTEVEAPNLLTSKPELSSRQIQRTSLYFN